MGSNVASQWICVRFRNKEARARTASAVTPSTPPLVPTASVGPHAGAAAAAGDDAGSATEAPTYLQLLVPVLLRFVQTDVPDKLRDDLLDGNTATQMMATGLLEAVLQRVRVFAHTADELRQPCSS